MAKIWYDKDVSLESIKNELIAVIGYGIQGYAQANNLRDSGLKVIIGLRKGKSFEKAVRDGFEVYEIGDAARKADIVHVLIPDMEQKHVYKDKIESNLSEGKALSFSHGASIHCRWIEPPNDVDVIMIAPKAPGALVRELYQQGFGVPALVAVYKDYTGKAWNRALGIAKGIGSTRCGVIKTTFAEETETDWFGEQVDLCGGVDRLIRLAFETLIEEGYQPEVCYFECLHELKLIVDLIQRFGIEGMYRRVSETARYGGLSRGGKIIDDGVKRRMKEALKNIRNGSFADEWMTIWNKEGKQAFEKYLSELNKHEIEKIGRNIRKMIWPEVEGGTAPNRTANF